MLLNRRTAFSYRSLFVTWNGAKRTVSIAIISVPPPATCLRLMPSKERRPKSRISSYYSSQKRRRQCEHHDCASSFHGRKMRRMDYRRRGCYTEMMGDF